MISPSLFGCASTEESDDVACIALNAVAVQLAANSEWDKALSAWRKLLTQQRSNLGSVHENVATTLNNIGVALCMLEDMSAIEAEMSFEEALWIMRSIHGDGDETRNVEHNLSLLQHNEEVKQGLKPGGEIMTTFISSLTDA
mmetsp:Transcript_3609/g.4609  ORF Transcript_3609/g.4609 Transcript_3609/m.4609 type:complete len:142 (-) Transcript_3609:584-1009(-)